MIQFVEALAFRCDRHLVNVLNAFAALPPESRAVDVAANVRKDAAFSCLGALDETLKVKKAYKSQLEPLLITHVLPEVCERRRPLRCHSSVTDLARSLPRRMGSCAAELRG